jgi:hypothetical protein
MPHAYRCPGCGYDLIRSTQRKYITSHCLKVQRKVKLPWHHQVNYDFQNPKLETTNTESQ